MAELEKTKAVQGGGPVFGFKPVFKTVFFLLQTVLRNFL